MPIDPFDPWRGGATSQLLSDIERMTESSRRLQEAALGPSNALGNAIRQMNGINDAVLRVTVPAYRIGNALQEAIDRLQIPTLYEPGGALARFDERMSSLAETINRATVAFEGIGATMVRLQPSIETGERLVEALGRLSVDWHSQLDGWAGAGVTSRLLAQAVEAQSIVQQQRTSTLAQQARQSSLLLDGLVVIEDELGQATTPEGVRSALAKLLAVFSQRLAKARSGLEAQALANVISLLMMVLAIYALLDARAGQEELLDAIRSGPMQVATSIEQLQRDHQSSTKALVEQLASQQAIVALTVRPAIVRVAPQATASMIERLPAHEVLEFVELRGGWAHVRFYDAIQDSFVDGWVYGKLVRVLPRGNDR